MYGKPLLWKYLLSVSLKVVHRKFKEIKMRGKKTWIFVASFLFQDLINLHICLINFDHVKLEATLPNT